MHKWSKNGAAGETRRKGRQDFCSQFCFDITENAKRIGCDGKKGAFLQYMSQSGESTCVSRTP
uniref:Uncharacterized protein n=1 Tax=Romanomermis culicivorax TaxID=13658 RepID=A0A915JBY6_ROMCU